MTAWLSAFFMLSSYRKLQQGGGKAENSCKWTSYATRVVFQKVRFPFCLWRVLQLFVSVISSVRLLQNEKSVKDIYLKAILVLEKLRASKDHSLFISWACRKDLKALFLSHKKCFPAVKMRHVSTVSRSLLWIKWTLHNTLLKKKKSTKPPKI